MTTRICPECGGPMSRGASMCQPCHLASRKRIVTVPIGDVDVLDTNEFSDALMRILARVVLEDGSPEINRDWLERARAAVALNQDRRASKPPDSDTDPLVALSEHLSEIRLRTHKDPTAMRNFSWGPGWVQPATATPVTGTGYQYAQKLATAAGVFGLDHLWGWQMHALALVASGLRVTSIIVCRQNGKTTLLYLLALDGLIAGHNTAFTLHQRSLAREKWEEISVALTTAFPGRFKASKRQGNEQIVDLVTDGKFKLTTPDDAGGRSDTFDRLIVDEAAHIRSEYLAAAKPSTATKDHAQTILISSGMDDQSIDLAAARDTAYGQLAADASERTHGIVEWSAKTTPGHDGIDLDDEGLWADCIPTLGLEGGVTLASVREGRSDMGSEHFAREYLSVPTGSPLTPPIIPSLWQSALTENLLEKSRMMNVCIGFDTNPIQTRSSVAVAGLIDGRMHCAVLANDDGDDWLPDELLAAARELRPMTLVADAKTPATQYVDRLKRRGWDVTTTHAQDTARSCAAFLTHVHSETVTIVADDALTAAAVGAVRRHIADAGWAWDRRDGTGLDITPLVAVSLAVARVHHYGTLD